MKKTEKKTLGGGTKTVYRPETEAEMKLLELQGGGDFRHSFGDDPEAWEGEGGDTSGESSDDEGGEG